MVIMCRVSAMYCSFVDFSVVLVEVRQQLNPAPCVMLVEARQQLNPAPTNSILGRWDLGRFRKGLDQLGFDSERYWV